MSNIVTFDDEALRYEVWNILKRYFPNENSNNVIGALIEIEVITLSKFYEFLVANGFISNDSNII